jgi:hypothetical protein
MRLFENGDMDAINAWYAAHKQPPARRDLLPETGFIVPGVAAGFLFRTDSRLAFVHNVVTNPDASLRARFVAVRDIVRACQELARALGVAGLVTWTNAPSIVRLACQNGGRVAGDVTLITQEI